MAMADFEETGFWQAYDVLAEDAPQLRVWKKLITAMAPPENSLKEESDERFLINQSGVKVIDHREIYNLPDVLPLIAGMLEAGSVSMLYSVSGTGKYSLDSISPSQSAMAFPGRDE